MPDFVVAGEPGVVLTRAGVMRTRAGVFTQVSDSLAAVTTGGWSGRAADRFADRFEVEPVRWAQASEGFVTAAAALEQYAQTLSWAQEQAGWARDEWERGEQATVSARADYEADVAAGRTEKAAWEVDNGPGTFTLTVHPFTDPGEPIRAGAVSTHQDTLAQLQTAAHTCAAGVRAGCAHAPDKRNWAQSGFAFVGGVFAGAGEAVWDLAQLGFRFSPAGMIYEMTRLATGELTPEEMAAKWQLRAETAQGLLTALREDPIGFGKNMGKSLLDWDTWADDPARALGHLVPDAIAAAFTAGTATAVTRGASATSAFARHADDLANGVPGSPRDPGGPLSLPLNQFPRADPLRRYMDNIPAREGFYDVGLHGAPDAVEIALSDGRRLVSDHRLLASMIQRAPDYDGGPVRLLSCSTGSPAGTFAQDLANKLGRTVQAPTRDLWVFPNGRTVIGESSKFETGKWDIFLPGGPK